MKLKVQWVKPDKWIYEVHLINNIVRKTDLLVCHNKLNVENSSLTVLDQLIDWENKYQVSSRYQNIKH